MAKEPLSVFIATCNPMAKNGPYTKAINEQYKYDYNDWFFQ